MNGLEIAFAVGVVILVLVFFFLRGMLMFALNTVIGFFALFGWNVLFSPLKINFLSVLIVAIGGIFGLAIVAILHFLGIYF